MMTTVVSDRHGELQQMHINVCSVGLNWNRNTLKPSHNNFWLLSSGTFQSFPPFSSDILEITVASIQHSFFSSDSCEDTQNSLDKHFPQWKCSETLDSLIFQILLKSPDSPTLPSQESTYGRWRAKRELALTESFFTSPWHIKTFP